MLLVLFSALNWRVAIVTKKPFFSKWHDEVSMKNWLLNEVCFCLGGYDGKKYLNTTEIIYPNGSKTEGPELPESRDGHCLVEYAGIIISMGGQYETHNGQFWSNTWIPLFFWPIGLISEFKTFDTTQSPKFRPQKLSITPSSIKSWSIGHIL